MPIQLPSFFQINSGMVIDNLVNMLRRYLLLFKTHVIIIILLIALIIVGTVTVGELSFILSVLTGIVMIYAGIVFTLYIIRIPAKKKKDEGS